MATARSLHRDALRRRFCRSIRLANVDSIRQKRSSRAAFRRCPNHSSERQIAFCRRRRLDQETGRRQSPCARSRIFARILCAIPTPFFPAASPSTISPERISASLPLWPSSAKSVRPVPHRGIRKVFLLVLSRRRASPARLALHRRAARRQPGPQLPRSHRKAKFASEREC